MGKIIVVDLGKTLSKITLWTRTGDMIDRQTRQNTPYLVDGITCLDIPSIGDWIIRSLARYAGEDIETIIPVGHGAGVVAIPAAAATAAADADADADADTVTSLNLHPCFAPLDYEQAIPPLVLGAYRQQRDPFAVTGSPALPDGLNIGAQLHWLDQLYPAAMAQSTLLPWAQYWAWFLSGTAVSEVTSLGCHSDLWNPLAGCYSPLAVRRGWAARFAPMVHAGARIGYLRPAMAQQMGLPPTTEILAGLHDSNAALLAARGFPEIAQQDSTILSTGTWFVAMRSGAKIGSDFAHLSETSDCLVNVDAFHQPILSARFMGGREIESIIQIDTRRVDIKPDQPKLIAAVPDILRQSTMMLPSLAQGSGPFPAMQGHWLHEPHDWYARRAAMCLYAALVIDHSLSLIGSTGRILIEGRFAEAEVFVRALAALRPDTQIFTANAHHDVSFGALRLIDPSLAPQGQLMRVQPLSGAIAAYRDQWRSQCLAKNPAPASAHHAVAQQH